MGVVNELLSDSTASIDRTLKKNLYQDRFRTPEYFWFSPETLEFEGFRLVGHTYESIELNQQGWRWSQELELFLGIDQGQLRYFQPTGQIVPTPAEAANAQIQIAEAETQRANREAQRAEAEAQRADQEMEKVKELTKKLQDLGIDLD